MLSRVWWVGALAVAISCGGSNKPGAVNASTTPPSPAPPVPVSDAGAASDPPADAGTAVAGSGAPDAGSGAPDAGQAANDPPPPALLAFADAPAKPDVAPSCPAFP